MERNVTITGISDTHGVVSLPSLLKDCESDFLVHCGDFTAGPVDRIARTHIYDSHRETWDLFVNELKAIRHQFKHVVVVPGNHDQICEVIPDECIHRLEEIEVHLLMNDGVVLEEELRVWGIPHTPPFYHWFFQGYDMDEYISQIPESTNILVTHGPPYGILDEVSPQNQFTERKPLGCRSLRRRCLELPKLKAAFFGHIHSAHGQHRERSVDYYNCSVLDERYDHAYTPIQTAIKMVEV